MNNTIGEFLKLHLFGESHGEYIGATLEGMSAGVKIDYDFIDLCLKKRRPVQNLDTPRIEKDDYKIISGVFNGYTTGDPITFIIKNDNTKSQDYSEIKDKVRPSHADYTKYIKTNGFNDYRGGGATSARLTAPLVGLLSIVLKALENKGIYIASHIASLGNVKDSLFTLENALNEIKDLNNKSYPTICDIEDEMNNEILSYRSNNDSIGGTVETICYGVEAGLGEPWFNSVESAISKAMFSIPALKGIEFGLGFAFANKSGALANDIPYLDENNNFKTRTNNNGGINGGITNSMPIIFKTVYKPTASISKPQDTINIKECKNDKIKIEGRHDPAVVRRAPIIQTLLTAFVIADFYLIKHGEDALR